VKVGDAILKVDGAAVDRLESAQVRSLMEDHAAGEKANLVLRRDGREIAVSNVLAAGKPD
jgi:S1-C subfamily serine protease